MGVIKRIDTYAQRCQKHTNLLLLKMTEIQGTIKKIFLKSDENHLNLSLSVSKQTVNGQVVPKENETVIIALDN